MDNSNNVNQHLGKKLSELVNLAADDPNELLRHRYLCREGVLGFYGPTGIGKSSLSMQCMISWALGREAFGIKPRQPLKSLLIQAENDTGDLIEMRDGIIKGLGLTEADAKQACDNVIVHQEDSRVGASFINLVVVVALQQHRPDLLWIDPALSYLGGDTLSQKDVGEFLRNLLKPQLKIHQCGCVIVHHTNKNKNGETAYAGSGSAEWANMPRAVLTLTDKANGLFELKATKRGSRLHWKSADNKTPTDSKSLKHSKNDGEIYWLEADANECLLQTKQDSAQDKAEMILTHVPSSGTIEKKKLENIANALCGIAQNKAPGIINALIENGQLTKSLVPRDNARPEVHVRRPTSSNLSPAVAHGVANGHA